MDTSRALLTSILLFSLMSTHAAVENKYLKEAKEYLQQGETQAAVIELKNALQQDPANIEARLLLGKLYLQSGDGASAEKEIERAIRLDADKALWQVELGKAYLLQNKFKEIINSIESDTALSGEIQAEVYNLRGRAYLATGAHADAQEAFQQALAQRPGDEVAELGLIQVTILSGDRQTGEPQLDSFLEKFPDNIEGRLLRGELLRQSKQNDRAMADYNYVLDKSPGNLRALLGRTTLYLLLANHDAAAKDLEALAKIAPTSPLVQYLQAVFNFQQGKLEQAEELLVKVLNQAPNHTQSQLIYGAILFRKGEYVAADEYLSRALAMLPGHLQTIKLVAAVKIKLRQFDQAISVLEAGLKDHRDDAQLRVMLGNVFLQTGRFEEGSELLAKAVEQMPDQAALRTQLAFGLLAQGETKNAIDELQSAVDLGQDLIQADVLLVLSHLRNKEIEQALKASQALEQRSPDNPLAYNLSGLAWMASGDEASAREKFLKALELDPMFVTAHINIARIELGHNRLEETEVQFKAVLDKVPSNITALLGMAGLEARRKNREGMYDWLIKARDLNPNSSKPGILLTQSYLQDGENLKALRAARESVSSFPNDAEVLQVLGIAQIATGEVNSAIQSFRQLVEVNKSPQTLTQLANTLKRIDNYSEARINLSLALQIDPNYLPALTSLGDVAFKEGELTETQEIAKRIQREYPDQSIGYQMEAAGLLKQNQSEPAIGLLERAYQLQPTAQLALQLSRLHHLNGATQKSLDQLSDWLQKQPADVEVRSVYANRLQQLGDIEKAALQYETVLQTAPDNVTVLNNLGWIYQQQGDRRALEVGGRAFQLAPEKPEIVDTYGWILVNFGETQKGLVRLKEAFAKMPDNPEVAYHVGYALSKAGNNQEAKKVLMRIVRDHKGTGFAEQAEKLHASLK
ncbi:MAG: PEP-CTERM system TPR-repeat protein PrsT [Chromatiaceae bacterium]|nr:PEP-CTERM system TPR-repeat protein PrsT [Chromatiaceae bacterium]